MITSFFDSSNSQKSLMLETSSQNVLAWTPDRKNKEAEQYAHIPFYKKFNMAKSQNQWPNDQGKLNSGQGLCSSPRGTSTQHILKHWQVLEQIHQGDVQFELLNEPMCQKRNALAMVSIHPEKT